MEEKTVGVDLPPPETGPAFNNTTRGVRETITFGPNQQCQYMEEYHYRDYVEEDNHDHPGEWDVEEMSRYEFVEELMRMRGKLELAYAYDMEKNNKLKGLHDELIETRKNNICLGVEIRDLKEALGKEKLRMERLRRETGVWDEEPESGNRDFTRISRVMTLTKDGEESSDSSDGELDGEEYIQEMMRQDRLRIWG